MLVQTAAALVLVVGLITPVTVNAQFRLSRISVGDIERAVRIGSMIYDATRSERRSTGTSRTGSTASRGDGGSRTSTAGSGAGAGSSRLGARAVATGNQYLGVPYQWGGETPAGFDCSGFVQYVYARQNVRLPRNSRQQAQVGEELPARVTVLRQGDLMFFSSSGGTIDHVAMYAGANRILHSSSSGGGVRYDDLASRRGRWFADHMVAARRVATDGRSLVNALVAAKLTFDGFDPPDLAPRTSD